MFTEENVKTERDDRYKINLKLNKTNDTFTKIYKSHLKKWGNYQRIKDLIAEFSNKEFKLL